MAECCRGFGWRVLSLVFLSLGYVVLAFTWPASMLCRFGGWLAEMLLYHADGAATRGDWR